MTLAVNLGWTDYALRDALERELGRPVVIENDARAAAIGLHARGIAGANDDLAYLAVGTGIAAGVILDGRLHRGARGLAGEIGHAIAERDGPRCVCGQHGCLEAFASGPSIARRANELGSHATSAVEVYAAAAAGDPIAGSLIDDVGRRLAWAVHLLVMTYDVERVVVGGGVSHAGAQFEAPLRPELARLRAASGLRPPSCCPPTSSMSCRPDRRPAPGAPSPSRGQRTRTRPRPRRHPVPRDVTASATTRAVERRWSVTPDAAQRAPQRPSPTDPREEHRGGVMHTKRFLGLALTGHGGHRGM